MPYRGILKRDKFDRHPVISCSSLGSLLMPMSPKEWEREK
jgi:hypothetical protein